MYQNRLINFVLNPSIPAAELRLDRADWPARAGQKTLVPARQAQGTNQVPIHLSFNSQQYLIHPSLVVI
jgi:hypothetical protein